MWIDYNKQMWNKGSANADNAFSFDIRPRVLTEAVLDNYRNAPREYAERLRDQAGAVSFW